jgi:hypothetical protein
MDKNTIELLLRTLTAERDRIDGAISELKGQMLKANRNDGGMRGTAGQTSSSGRPRRTMSAAARRKISEAMKRRYAELAKGKK